MLVGIVTYAAVWILQVTPFQVANVFAVFYFSIVASLFMGAVGLLGGIWADKFDHMAAVQNFVIMPLTMLSGTFYPIGRLPEPFVTISHFNPFFQMIDGFPLRVHRPRRRRPSAWRLHVAGHHAGALCRVLVLAEPRLRLKA